MSHAPSGDAAERAARRGETFRRPGDVLSLATGFLGPPVIALAALHGFYPLAAQLCGRAGETPFHAGSAFALLLVLGCGALAWRMWRRVGTGWPDDEDGAVGRTRFLAASGLVSAGIFGLIIVAQWLPTLFSAPCVGKGT